MCSTRLLHFYCCTTSILLLYARVHVDETPRAEKVVGGEGEGGADAPHGADGVGARAQVGDGAQELKRVSLLLQGVRVRRAGADQLKILGGVSC